MSDKTWNVSIDLESVLFVICLFALIVLCVGEPDLLDSIIAWVGRQP